MKPYLESLKTDMNTEIDGILNDNKLNDNDKTDIIQQGCRTMRLAVSNVKRLYDEFGL